jgi:histidinol-phosphate aminotransferase
VQRIEPIRESFNLNAFALAGAEAALSDAAHLLTVRDGNEIERTWLQNALSGLGFSVLPSQTNFLLVRFGERTADIELGLLNRGIVVRPMAGYGLSEYLRVTVSNRLENQRLLSALSEIDS